MTFPRSCVVMAVFCLLMLRPITLTYNTFLDVVDDQNYLAHATMIVYGQFPRYTAEYVTANPFNHSVGPGLMAVPFVLAFSLIDRVNDHPVTYRRTRESVTTSWTGYGFSFASQFYLLLGMLLMERTCARMGGARTALAALLSIISCGIPLFAYRRAIFSHTFEYAAIAGGLYLIAAAEDPWARRRRWLYWSAVVVAAALIFLVRYNNLPYACAVLLSVAYRTGKFAGRRVTARTIVRAGLIGVVLPLAFAWGFHELAHRMTAGLGPIWNKGVVLDRALDQRDPGYFALRVIQIMIGYDWGLVFTAPLIVLGLFGSYRWGKDHRFLLLFLGAALANFILIMLWGTQGSNYGYRYFVNGALPAATVGVSFWFRRGPGTERGRLWVTVALCIVPVISMLLYETADNLVVHLEKVGYSDDWLNRIYLVEVAKTVVDPARLISYVALPGAGDIFRNYLAVFLLGRDPIYPVPVLVKWSLSMALPFAFAAAHVLITRGASQAAPRDRVT